MRKILIGCMFVCALNANAQFSLSAGGGWNVSTLYIKRKANFTEISNNSISGWQAAIQASFAIKHWFIYTGAGITQNNFKQSGADDYVQYEGYDTTTYHPLYISIPVGIGYQFKLAPKLALRLYTGMNGAVAIGGKLRVVGTNCPEFACFETPPVTRKIEYGNTASGSKVDDLEATNYGLQFGAALRALKRYEFGAEYSMGLQNMIPGLQATESNKLRTFALSVRYYLVR